MSRAWVVAAQVVLPALTLAACCTNALGPGGADGSLDGTPASDGADAALPVFIACEAFCQVDRACCAAVAGCDVESAYLDCYSYRCFPEMTTGITFEAQSAACREAWRAYYTCLATQPMPCSPDTPQATNVPGDCLPLADPIKNYCLQ